VEFYSHTNQFEKFEIYQKKLNYHIFNKNFKEIRIREKESFKNLENKKYNTQRSMISSYYTYNNNENNIISIEDNDIKEYRSSKMIKKNFIKFKAKSNSISIGELNKNQQKNFLRKNTFNMKNTFNEVKGILN
jgi:hypothetical protein